jgi:hypothetical protein
MWLEILEVDKKIFFCHLATLDRYIALLSCGSKTDHSNFEDSDFTGCDVQLDQYFQMFPMDVTPPRPLYP